MLLVSEPVELLEDVLYVEVASHLVEPDAAELALNERLREEDVRVRGAEAQVVLADHVLVHALADRLAEFLRLVELFEGVELVLHDRVLILLLLVLRLP